MLYFGLSRKNKIAFLGIIILAVVLLGVLAYNGINNILNQRRLKNLEVNGEKYFPEQASAHESSPLEGMSILYLGSSVTNGCAYAIEGVLSPDGRVLGKMGHSERIGKNLYKNVVGEYDMKLFESAVKYFK